MTWKPHVTVAAVVERDGRFLLVEEEVDGQLVLNQPAGHVEDGESLTNAVVREALEETAWDFAPEAVIGLYLWKEPTQGVTYLRTAFTGHCAQHHEDRELDAGIRQALWLSREEIVSRAEHLRSPLVLLCVDDYLRGRRYPLDLIQHLNSQPPPIRHTMNSGKRVMVGMSGGVDSSVSAAFLIDQGYSVEGLFMSNWAEDEQGYCTAAEDFQDAARVCNELNIPLHRADFSEEYRDRVFKYFLREYATGRTPNPDVLCNREIKFKSFLDYALRLGADLIATGHYARLRQGPEGLRLLRSADSAKDQTYFLCAVPAESLASVLFPIGGLLKSEVRQIAAQRGFPNHDKKDSTGICFIGERRFRDFLSGYLPAQEGPICYWTATGQRRELGTHNGLMYYTLGQRRGLGIGGRREAEENPWYVISKDLETNTLWVSQDAQHPNLRQHRVVTETMHWIGSPPTLPLHCTGRIRHRHADQPCMVRPAGNGIEVVFDEPQQALAPGQFVVLYEGEVCLGGAAIDRLQP